ncbi:MAG: hypothetical protein NVS4B6_17000 [Mycobacterium sp.]
MPSPLAPLAERVSANRLQEFTKATAPPCTRKAHPAARYALRGVRHEGDADLAGGGCPARRLLGRTGDAGGAGRNHNRHGDNAIDLVDCAGSADIGARPCASDR